MVLGDNGFYSSRITDDVSECITKVVLSNPISSGRINTNLFGFFIVSRRHYSFVTFLFFVHDFFSNTPVNKFLNIVYQCVILRIVYSLYVRGGLHNDNSNYYAIVLYIMFTHISCGIIIRISDGPLFVTEMKKINIKMHTCLSVTHSFLHIFRCRAFAFGRT